MKKILLPLKLSKAFTLIEVMIAMLILAIGLLGLAGMTVVVLRSNMVAQQITEATNLTTSMMEALKLQAPRISAGCPTLSIIVVPADASTCKIVSTSGVGQLHVAANPWLPPVYNDVGCSVAGILTSNRTFDVTTSNLGVLAQTVTNFCDYDSQIQPGQYVRYYRVVDGAVANERNLRAVVLWVDRFGKWRNIRLETTVRRQ